MSDKLVVVVQLQFRYLSYMPIREAVLSIDPPGNSGFHTISVLRVIKNAIPKKII